MVETSLSKRLSLVLGAGTAAWLLAAPTTAQACSVSPDIVDETRVTQRDESCLTVETWGDPGDYELPTLRIKNDCSDSIEVRIPDCAPCYEHAYETCFDCGQEWVRLSGEATGLVVQLDFPVDDHLGETVDSSIGWARGEESGELIIELDMVDKHPNQQANEACPGLCSVSDKGPPPATGALLMFLGMWGRSRKRRATGA